MEDLKNSKSNSFDYSLVSDLDLTSQLRDKIRSQAQRLRGLEQYRLLCEEYIKELMPNHPFPITKDHLGSRSSIIQDLCQSKERIKTLESQLSSKNKEKTEQTKEKTEQAKEKTEQTKEKTEQTKEKIHENEDYLILLEKYNDLLQDKTDLEESLRAEMLNGEEQRTYIEFLKENFRSKTDNFDGLLIDHKYMPYSSNFDIEASKRQQIKLQQIVLDYETKFKTVQSQLKFKDNENEALMGEREQIDFHLQQAAEALIIAEEEVSRLESEKRALTEYMEEHTVKEKEMQRELNDLSRYFEEMKKDYHNSLVIIDEKKGTCGRLEQENKQQKEEILKIEKLLNEKNEIIEKIKENLNDKVKKNNLLKEEKTNLEIKIEKLQSNVASLTESLKSLQMASSSLQENLDFSSKQDLSKSENLNKLKLENASLSQEIFSVTEKANELEKEIEKEKRSKIELERMRELDIRQIQEFKSKLGDLQEKCGKLEYFKEKYTQIDQIHKADLIKITQLEEKLSYLNETLKEYEYKDMVSDNSLNELQAENSDLIKEINEICDKNKKIQAELEKKNKQIESFGIKFNQLNEFCKGLEFEKGKLELVYEQEKAQNHEKHEQILADKGKIEELEKFLHNSRKIKENVENSLTFNQEKLRSLKQKLKTTEKELENEQKNNQKLSFDIKEHLKLSESKDYDLEKLKTAIANFCKTISAFCGKFTIVYNDYRSCISTKYKEFLNN